MPEMIERPSLHALLYDKYGVKTTEYENPLGTSIATTITRILPLRPQRLGLVLANLGANNAYVMWDNLPSASRGLLLAANGGTINFIWDEDFSLVARGFWAIAIGGAVDYSALEIVSI